MAIRCENLFQLKSFEKIRLVAGKNGLHRNVTWVYINQAKSLKNWIHGGELVFLTGMEGSTEPEEVKNLIQECIEEYAAGVVILCNENYIPKIPEEGLKMAEQADFPVFEMPWNVKIVDVTKEICNQIVLTQAQDRSIKNFFYEMLFADQVDEKKIKNCATFCKIYFQSPAFISEFRIHNLVNYHEEEHATNLQNQFARTINNSYEKYGKILTFVHMGNIICYMEVDKAEEQKQSILLLQKQIEKFSKKNGDLQISGGIGKTYTDITQFIESYRQAHNARKMSAKMLLQRQFPTVEIFYYEKMGILQLVDKIEDKRMIQEYCDNLLGGLLNLEEPERTLYLETLKKYLYHDCVMVDTARDLFLHRNTLVYRMNKIKQILGTDLSDMQLKAEYCNAFKLMEYYDIKK